MDSIYKCPNCGNDNFKLVDGNKLQCSKCGIYPELVEWSKIAEFDKFFFNNVVGGFFKYDDDFPETVYMKFEYVSSDSDGRDDSPEFKKVTIRTKGRNYKGISQAWSGSSWYKAVQNAINDTVDE